MRLPALLLAGAILFSGAVIGLVMYKASQERREWAELRSLKNHDLYHARYEDRALELVSRRLSGLTLPPAVGLVPWAVLELKPAGQDLRVLILEHASAAVTDGGQDIRCSTFSEQSVLLSSCLFQGGRNLVLRESRTTRFPGCSEDFLAFHCEPLVDGTDIACQYYALRDNRPILLRVENKAGTLASNLYVNSRAPFGPEPQERSDAEWENALLADDVCEILRALGWLAGDQARGGTTKPERVAALLGRLRVKERILQLRESTLPWIAEAARALPLEGSTPEK